MKKVLISVLIALLSSSFLSSQQSVSYNVNFAPYRVTDTLYENNNTTYHKVALNNCDIVLEEGKPILPVKYVRLLIPRGTKATNVVITQTGNEQITTLSHKICYATPLIPVGELIENKEKGLDSTLYSQSTPFPTSRVSVVEQSFFRGNCIVTIAVYPILYLPSNNQISYVSDIGFSLEYASDAKHLKDMYFDENDRILLSRMIDNPDDVAQFAPINISPASRGAKNISVNAKYLVVTERKLLPAFAELLDWKRRKGLSSQAVAIEDILTDTDYPGDLISNIYDDAGKLRQFLFDAYQQGVEYVLLAGANIPIRKGSIYNDPYTNSHITNEVEYYIIPTDLYFSDFDGDWNIDEDIYYGESQDNVDYTSEIYIGRIMPQNEWEVKNWTRKLLIYEQNPGNGDGSYLTKGFFTQADQLQLGREVQRYWKPNINWMTSYTLFEEEGGHDTPVTPNFPKGVDVVNEFNNHYAVASFLAHGSPNRVAIATKRCNAEEEHSKHYVTSFDSDYSSYMVEIENGNGLDNMTNYCHPTVFYSISCTTMPFDNYDKWNEGYRRNMGDLYTCVAKGGGAHYIGNTRYGYVGSSSYLAGLFFRVTSQEQWFTIGKLEAMSKTLVYDKYLKYSHNLMGCPETELWTGVPNHFTDVQIQEDENVLFVDAGVNDVSICVMSALDNGETYYQTINNVSSFRFQNTPKPYSITITKHNYFPYLYNPNDLYIQNINWDNERVISANKIFIGSNVTDNMPFGNVVINAPANTLLKPIEDVIIQSDFEVKSGANFEIKTNNNHENTCL